ncbi:MAG: hypothetical protein QNJ70_28705, partial [Xenococcaceae cyanobacterium MO_207.B15]|nr:hypothetical protein [Xenococcaceae cyanobacterium MO_207.B15]
VLVVVLVVVVVVVVLTYCWVQQAMEVPEVLGVLGVNLEVPVVLGVKEEMGNQLFQEIIQDQEVLVVLEAEVLDSAVLSSLTVVLS